MTHKTVRIWVIALSGMLTTFFYSAALAQAVPSADPLKKIIISISGFGPTISYALYAISVPCLIAGTTMAIYLIYRKFAPELPSHRERFISGAIALPYCVPLYFSVFLAFHALQRGYYGDAILYAFALHLFFILYASICFAVFYGVYRYVLDISEESRKRVCIGIVLSLLTFSIAILFVLNA